GGRNQISKEVVVNHDEIGYVVPIWEESPLMSFGEEDVGNSFNLRLKAGPTHGNSGNGTMGVSIEHVGDLEQVMLEAQIKTGEVKRPNDPLRDEIEAITRTTPRLIDTETQKDSQQTQSNTEVEDIRELERNREEDMQIIYDEDGNMLTVQAIRDLSALVSFHVFCGEASLAWNIEDLVPPSERYIFNFSSKDDLKTWHLYSDSEYGGLSSAALEIKDTGNGSTSVGVFSGNLSLDVMEGSKWNMTRSGFCGMRSKKFDGFIDLDGYDTIALKLKGDGRCYISTIYTENWVNTPGQDEDNSWQAFVFVPKENWYIAKIPLTRYAPTWRGNLINARLEMNPARIVGMSLSVNAEGGVPGAKFGPGDFKVEVDWIKALRM
ncbi:hypothetical protein HAX54_022677, partial [Datura stramonium]|nr:hypothetical protein [Datura stramonium]